MNQLIPQRNERSGVGVRWPGWSKYSHQVPKASTIPLRPTASRPAVRPSSSNATWNPAAGAACFLVCALATLLTGRTIKAPRLRRLVDEIEHRV